MERDKGLVRRCSLRAAFGLPLATILTSVMPLAQAQQVLQPQDLVGLSLEDLANLQITSVSRKLESVADAPASIYVITADDIRRSGATTLPEILRLAPNLQVARIDAVQYAITARGFNNSIGNKLLVLIDGRTIYTPLFSGVFWEMQDTMLEDIERIEVISGPGATLWGANAVNGVINIITRPVAHNESTLLSSDAGNNERGVALRSGAVFGAMRLRAYAKARQWDNTVLESGAPVHDSWKRQQAGFRAEMETQSGSFTVQGDAFTGESEARGAFGTLVIPAEEISGANLLARWNHHVSATSDLQVQAYWNHNERDEFVLFSPQSDILDFEFQHSFALGEHRLLWGGGYRRGEDEVGNGIFTDYKPNSRVLDWQNIYLQDELALAENLKLTAGLKLEWNDYTGMETLPTLRLGWRVTQGHFLWAAVSRAVRAPSRFDRDVFFPQNPPYIVAGGPNFVSEIARVYEVGYRGLLGKVFQLSATAYYHDWDKLRSGTPLPLPTYLTNGIEGGVWGIEAWINWQLTANWRIGSGLTTLKKDLMFSPGNSDTAGTNNNTLHNDPDYQWTLRSSTDFGEHYKLELNLRRIAELTVQPVPAYTELEAKLAWAVSPQLEVALTGFDLLHASHAEFGAAASRSRIQSNVQLGFRWTF